VGLTTYAFNPVVILRDILNRGRKEYQPADQQSDVQKTLRLKESFALHIQRIAEKTLNVFSLGDVVAICARS